MKVLGTSVVELESVVGSGKRIFAKYNRVEQHTESPHLRLRSPILIPTQYFRCGKVQCAVEFIKVVFGVAVA